MHTIQIAKNCQTKKINMKNIEMYKPLPVVKVNNTCSRDNKMNEMVALFMDSCSTTSGSCVQCRLLGPSDTYSTTSSQCEQSRLFHPISDSSSFTDSTHTQWVLPPYTPIDYRHYANAPIFKPTTVQIKTVQRTSRRSVWLGLIFGFSIFLFIVLGAVISYGIEQGML